MLALRALGQHSDCLRLVEVATPTPAQGEVLLRVRAAAICGSDIHIRYGDVSWRMDYPVTIGHEFCGEVVVTGDGVGTAIGERVVSETAAHVDASSHWSRVGKYNLDPDRLGFGAAADGGMASYVVVPERCLHRLPHAVSFEVGALAEPLSVAYQATCVRSDVKPGDEVAVIGAGPIGLLCAFLARRSGASSVVVCGLPSDQRRSSIAGALGADALLTGADAGRQRFRRTRLGGADLVIDAAGVSTSLQLALDLVRPDGQVTKVGWGPQPLGFSLDPLVAKGATLRGSFSHTWDVWERVLGLLEREAETISSIIGWSGPLDRWAEAFAAQESGNVIKSVLFP